MCTYHLLFSTFSNFLFYFFICLSSSLSPPPSLTCPSFSPPPLSSTIAHPKDPNVTLSLEDDAFIKICGMVTDGSLQVRCLSASLLGRFSSVSERFLLQTLDKKLMSHLQYVKSDHDRAREMHSYGSWDTGQRWGGGTTTKMNLDPSEVSLFRCFLDSIFCGNCYM